MSDRVQHFQEFTFERISDGTDANFRQKIREMNAKWPEQFYELKDRHLKQGIWWIVHSTLTRTPDPVGFCGAVPMHPFRNHWYLKRAAVVDIARGKHLQREMIRVRERELQKLGCIRVVTECAVGNIASANNIIAEGYKLCEPERDWADEPSLFFYKDLDQGNNG